MTTDVPAPRALVDIPADAKVIMPKLGVCSQHFRRNDGTGASEPMTSVTLLSVVPSRGETRVTTNNVDARRLPDLATIEQAFARNGRDPGPFAERAYGTADALTETREIIESFDITRIIDIITDLRPAMTRLKTNSPIKILYNQAVDNFVEVVHHTTGELMGDIRQRLNDTAAHVNRPQANAAPSSTTAAAAEAVAEAEKANKPAPFIKSSRALPPAPPAPPRADIVPGNMVVYPGSGICRIMDIGQQTIAGIAMDVVVLSKERDKLTVSVPLKKAKDALGAMPDRKAMAYAIRTLRQRPKAKVTGPSARWIAHNKAKLDSHDLQSAAEVVRDLRVAPGTELAYSYRVQLQTAFDTMSHYYAYIAKITYYDAMALLTRYAGVNIGSTPDSRFHDKSPAFDNVLRPAGGVSRGPRGVGRKSGRHFT